MAIFSSGLTVMMREQFLSEFNPFIFYFSAKFVAASIVDQIHTPGPFPSGWKRGNGSPYLSPYFEMIDLAVPTRNSECAEKPAAATPTSSRRSSARQSRRRSRAKPRFRAINACIRRRVSELGGLKVADVMQRRVVGVQASSTLRAFADQPVPLLGLR
jgi:hypothetical protein